MDALLTHPVFAPLFVVFLGAVLGSFATMLAHRSVHEEGWLAQIGVGKRSHCLSCQTPLKFLDLIPVLSWLLRRGRCAYCGAKIGLSYLLIELASIILCLGIFIVHGLSIEAVLMMLAVPLLLALLAADLQEMLLPDVLVLVLAFLGLVHMGWLAADNPFYWQDIVINHLGGGIAYGLVLYGIGMLMTKMLRKEALGMGDIKYFAAAGLWLGIGLLGTTMVFVGVAGIVFALVWKVMTKEDVFPFGPALIATTYIMFLIGGSLTL